MKGCETVKGARGLVCGRKQGLVSYVVQVVQCLNTALGTCSLVLTCSQAPLPALLPSLPATAIHSVPTQQERWTVHGLRLPQLSRATLLEQQPVQQAASAAAEPAVQGSPAAALASLAGLLHTWLGGICCGLSGGHPWLFV